MKNSPLGLNFQKEIGCRKDLLTNMAEAKAKIELRAKGREAHERAEYEEKKTGAGTNKPVQTERE